MKKRIFALLTLLVLVFSMATVSLADTKPTATLYNSYKNQTVAPGKTIYFEFRLKCGSYKKYNDMFRAKLGINVFNSSDKQVGAANWLWTGDQNYMVNFKIKKNTPVGTYTLKYTTYCRGKKETASWKKVKTKSVKFKVKK